MNMNKLFSKLVSPLPSKPEAPNPYGPELMGTISAGPTGSVSEQAVLDKCKQSKDYVKADNARTYLFSQIQELQKKLSNARKGSTEYNDTFLKISEMCKTYTQANERCNSLYSFFEFMESALVSKEASAYAYEHIPSASSSIRDLHEIQSKLFNESIECNHELFTTIQEKVDEITASFSECDIPSFNVLSTLLESAVVDNNPESALDASDYMKTCALNRLDEAVSIYESVYFLNDDSIESRRAISECRQELTKVIESQLEDRKRYAQYLERENSSSSNYLSSELMSVENVLRVIIERMENVYGNISQSKCDNVTLEDIRYMRENALTIKLKTFGDMLAVRRNPTNAELSKNSVWMKMWKKVCELNNQHEELIKQRERLYRDRDRSTPDKTEDIARKIDSINGKIGDITKKITQSQMELVGIELIMIEENQLSKGYWKAQIETNKKAIARLTERIEAKEKRVTFIKKLLSEDGVQGNPATKQSLETELVSTRNEIKDMESTIEDMKLTITKYKDALASAPDKSKVKDGKVVAESVGLGKRLDRLVDNYANRALRADDEFKEIDDKLWKAKAELSSLNKKAADLDEKGIIRVSDRMLDITEKIKSTEREVEKLQKDWEERLEHVSNFLPRSYWEKLWKKYEREYSYSIEMADAFSDEVDEWKKILKGIENNTIDGSAALARSNIKFYEERKKHYMDSAKAAKRLQKDCEERIDKLPKK